MSWGAPASVREVMDDLYPERPHAYMTVMTHGQRKALQQLQRKAPS